MLVVNGRFQALRYVVMCRRTSGFNTVWLFPHLDFGSPFGQVFAKLASRRVLTASFRTFTGRGLTHAARISTRHIDLSLPLGFPSLYYSTPSQLSENRAHTRNFHKHEAAILVCSNPTNRFATAPNRTFDTFLRCGVVENDRIDRYVHIHTYIYIDICIYMVRRLTVPTPPPPKDMVRGGPGGGRNAQGAARAARPQPPPWPRP